MNKTKTPLVYRTSCQMRQTKDDKWETGLFMGFVCGGEGGGIYLCRPDRGEGDEKRYNFCEPLFKERQSDVR